MAEFIASSKARAREAGTGTTKWRVGLPGNLAAGRTLRSGSFGLSTRVFDGARCAAGGLAYVGFGVALGSVAGTGLTVGPSAGTAGGGEREDDERRRPDSQA